VKKERTRIEEAKEEEESRIVDTSPDWQGTGSEGESSEARPNAKGQSGTRNEESKKDAVRLISVKRESDEECEEAQKAMKAKSKAKAKCASQVEEDDPFDTNFEEWYGPSIKEGSARNPWEAMSSWEGTQAAWARDVLPAHPGKVTLEELNYVHRPDEVWIPASIRIPEQDTTAMIEGIDFQYKESATLVPLMCLFGRLEFGHKAIVAVNFPRGRDNSSCGFAFVRWINMRMCQAFIDTINKDKNQGTRIPPSRRTIRAKMSDSDLVIPTSIARVSQGPTEGRPRYYGNVWIFPEDRDLDEYPPL
jgi:hypothetical protein